MPRADALASLRGRLAIVSAFASWCEPCDREGRIAFRLTDRLTGPETVEREVERLR